MTSRRSRLKAIANLPVRRKPVVAESCNEITPPTPESIVEQVQQNTLEHVPEKSLSSFPVVKEITKDINKVSEEIAEILVGSYDCPEGLDTQKVTNGSFEIPNQENEQNVNSASDLTNTNSLEINNDLNLNKNSSNSLFTFKSSKRFKPNVNLASVRERSQFQISKPVDQEVQKQIINDDIPEFNKNAQNISTDNLGDGSIKCYTVLTPVTVPNSTFTISSLAPCENSEDNILDQAEFQPEVFEEVQIYTELDTSDLYNNLSTFTTDATESNNLILEESGPVYATLNNCDTDQRLISVNLNICNLDSNISNVKIPSQTIFTKSPEKFKGKQNEKGVEVNQTNQVFQKQDKEEKSYLRNATADVDYNNLNYKKYAAIPRKKWNKNNDLTKKLADARRDFQKRYRKTKPDRSTLKMIDLIFYNPSTNPMESKSKVDKKEQGSEQGGGLVQELLAEERVDEPEADDSQMANNNESENLNKMPVPQVKIGLNGEIILDEKSLVIETTEAKKGREDLQNSVPIFEDRRCKVSYYGAKTKKTREWTGYETKRFYIALNTIGPDFSLMQKYFPRRSRIELKNKFKREERLNRNLIDRALNNPSEFDMTPLEKDLDVERKAQEEVEMRICMKRERRNPKKKKVKVRVKSSQLSRELIDSEGESKNSIEADEVQPENFSHVEHNKKQKEINFVFQKILLQTSQNQNS